MKKIVCDNCNKELRGFYIKLSISEEIKTSQNDFIRGDCDLCSIDCLLEKAKELKESIRG